MTSLRAVYMGDIPKKHYVIITLQHGALVSLVAPRKMVASGAAREGRRRSTVSLVAPVILELRNPSLLCA